MSVAALLALVLVSQNETPAPALPVSTRYVVEGWTVRDGLPQSSVNDITQDDAGFIWVATFGGVARFDGDHFVRADPPRADMDGHRFVSIAHAGGAVYAGTQRGRLFRFSPAGAGHTEVAVGAEDAIWDIWPEADGSLLLAAGTSGVWQVRGDRAERRADLGAEAYAVVRGPGGALWVLGHRGVHCVEAPCPPTPVVLDEEDRLAGLTSDSRWGVLLASASGVTQLRAGSPTLLDPRPGTLIHAAGEPEALWVVAGDTLQMRRGPLAERVLLSARTAVAQGLDDARPTLRALFVDRAGDLWVGSDDAGLFHVRDRHLEQIDHHRGLVGESVLLALPAADGSVWISTYCNGLQRWTPEGRVARIEGVAADACVDALAQDTDGTVWLDAAGRLARVVGDRAVPLPGLELGPVRTLLLTGGEGWVGTRRRGVLRVETGTVVARVGVAEGLPDEDVGALLELRDGALLAGTARGLALIEDGRARSLVDPRDHRAVHVRDLVMGSGGVVWVATYGDGLARLTPGAPGQPWRARWLTEADGFCTDNLSRIVIVGEHLWINSNRGVFRVSIDAVEALAAGRTRELRCHAFETGEGNGGGQVAGGRLPDGHLIFPTVSGLAIIDPEQVTSPPPPPAVHIAGAEVGGRALALDGTTVVPAGLDALSIELATPSFDTLGLPTFERSLTHDGETSVERGTARRIDYLGLAPGTYDFEVWRRDAEGRHGPSAKLRFQIAAAFHETALFRVGLPLLLLTLVGLLIRAWFRTLRSQSRALEAELAERRQAESARAERDQVYRTLFEGSPGPLFIHGPHGELVDLNPAARDLVGTPLPGAPPAAFVIESHRGAYLELLAQVMADGQRRNTEVPMLHGAGRQHLVRVDAALIEVGGERRVFVAATDVTAARDAEKQRAEMMEMTAASRRLEGLGRLAGGIAHDFNNVLAALTLQIDMLRSGSIQGPAADEITHEMLGAIERGRELTRRFLVFGRGAGEVKQTNLDDALLHAEGLLRRLLRPGVQLSVTPEAAGARVVIDPVHLDQVMMNLVLNAQDALTSTGTVRLGTHTPEGLGPDEVTILAPKPGPTVALTVEDDGVGMDQDVMARAFEPFYTTKTPGRGTGMGLAIVHGAATKAGAGITVRSARGRGTAVSIHFPLLPGSSAGLGSPARGMRLPARPIGPTLLRPDGRPRNALLCDDDPIVRHSLARLLQRRGLVDIVEVEDGSRALDRLRQDEFDLLITDFLMPGINGVELIRAVRTLDIRVPIILLSGFIGDATNGLDGVPSDVVRLQKPVEPDVLWARVVDAIGKRT